ncbi:hypothetical protein F183_A48910 [Bryobacterales bacterium F-183]|nr:hypothetical protein F183_A48910 [Bryobacterales bacterium F-183]
MRRALPYIASLFVGLLLGEAALRLLGARFSTSFYVIDPDLGWALRPGVTGTYTGESVTNIQINSAAMRDDREYPQSKPAGRTRVAILGDSFAEAMQVRIEQTVARQLEAKLACRPNPEVLNFGVQGYGTAQQLLVWRNKAKAYKPDTVVLLFYTGNDLYNNVRALNPTNANAAPYFTYDTATQKLNFEPALAEPSAAREAWASLVRVSKLAQFVTDAFYKLARPATDQNRDYMDKLIYRAPATGPMLQAWANTEALIQQLRREVEAEGSKFLLVLASSGMQVHPDPEMRRKFLEFTGGDDLFYTEKRLDAFAKSKGMQVIFLGESMQQTAEKSSTFYYGFPGNLGNGHWNAEGHRFAAQAISESICKSN